MNWITWISVKEKLPEMAARYDKNTNTEIVASEPVFVSKNGNSVMFGYFEKTNDGLVFVHVPVNYTVCDNYIYRLDEISHWTLIPDPMKIPKSDFEISPDGKLSSYRGKDIHVIIPDTVTSIGNFAFCYRKSLISVTIPNTVTRIGQNAFDECTSLERVVIPDSVTTIDSSAFSGCTSLTSIFIPDSVRVIGMSAFQYCSSLTTVEFGENSKLFEIGQNAFSLCSSLTHINLPNSVRAIGRNAFEQCSSLTHISLPNSLSRIEGFTFVNCRSLESINIPDSVTSIGSFAFIDCVSLRNANIPDSVTSIGEQIFEGCDMLNRYVFISYSTQNQEYADAMRYLLEQAGIKTWMAPYDIPAGKKYAAVINDAIEEASCVLLLLSEQSQASIWVEKEIERAVSNRKPIVSMHLDESQLSSEFKLYISDRQIVPVKKIDESDPNVQKVLDNIKSYVM